MNAVHLCTTKMAKVHNVSFRIYSPEDHIQNKVNLKEFCFIHNPHNQRNLTKGPESSMIQHTRNLNAVLNGHLYPLKK